MGVLENPAVKFEFKVRANRYFFSSVLIQMTSILQKEHDLINRRKTQ